MEREGQLWRIYGLPRNGPHNNSLERTGDAAAKAREIGDQGSAITL